MQSEAEVVQCSESNRKGNLSWWRKEALKKKDRDRKRKEKRRKERPRGGVARKNNKGAAICGMMKAAKPNHPATRKGAMRNYITQHVPGTHITFEQRNDSATYRITAMSDLRKAERRTESRVNSVTDGISLRTSSSTDFRPARFAARTRYS